MARRRWKRTTIVRKLLDEHLPWDLINAALYEAEQRGIVEPRRVYPVMPERKESEPEDRNLELAVVE